MKSDRRGFLKSGAALAGGFTLGAVAPGIAQAPGNGQTPGTGQTPKPERFIKAGKELVEYGERSHFVTSVRMAHPTGGRPSPDEFGLSFHIATPLQDQMGVITPSSLHHVATTRGSFIPDIDPREHRLMIHGIRSRPPANCLRERRASARTRKTTWKKSVAPEPRWTSRSPDTASGSPKSSNPA